MSEPQIALNAAAGEVTGAENRPLSAVLSSDLGAGRFRRTLKLEATLHFNNEWSS